MDEVMSLDENPNEETFAVLLPDLVLWGSEEDIAKVHPEGQPLYRLDDDLLRKVIRARGNHQMIRAMITYEGEVYDGFEPDLLPYS
jgi:hypothetical protein